MQRLVFTLTVLLLSLTTSVLLPGQATAHDSALGFMDVRVLPEAVQMELQLDYVELQQATGLPVDPLSASEPELVRALADGTALLEDYVLPRVRVYRDAVPCEPALAWTAAQIDDLGPGAVIKLHYPCAGDSTQIQYEIFFEGDRTHQNIAKISAGGEQREFIFTAYERELTVGEITWWRQALQFAWLGVEHIFTGYDHILFVISLLPAAASLGAVAELVTAFTLGHSITLGLATLGVLNLPAYLVEPAIALSIIYVAVQNLRGAEGQHRWVLTLLFGLVHGFGFAGILREMQLPTERLATSLLSFNLGVELGQIAILALAFPLVAAARRLAVYPRILAISSTSIAGLALFWFVERAVGF